MSPSWTARDTVYVFTNEQEVGFISPLPIPLYLWPWMAVFLVTEIYLAKMRIGLPPLEAVGLNLGGCF